MRRLTCIAVSLFLIGGCGGGVSSGPTAIDFAPETPPPETPPPETPPPETPPPETPPPEQSFVARYAPNADVGPYPNDIYNPVVGGNGSTLDVPQSVSSPLTDALNTLDGFSTTAAIMAPFSAPIDPATLIGFDVSAPRGTETVLVLDMDTREPLRPGLDYELRVSNAAGADSSVLVIEPVTPLASQTTYAFILTSGIQNISGDSAGADLAFGAIRDAHLIGLTSVPENPALDLLFPAITPLIDIAVDLLGLPGEEIVSAWSVTTQSIGDVLANIERNATAGTSALAFTGFATDAIDPALPGTADVYAGYLEIPYYGDPQDALGSFWLNSSAVPPTAADPVPLARVPELRIPLLATLPNSRSRQRKPGRGWPVVIYQHGVTLDRTTMLAIADSFASQGFAVVAIDLPLHGITDTNNPFYQGPENRGNKLGNNERHFYLDNFDALGRPIPDGEIDDGRQIFNVSNPLNARDHIRQAVSDLIHLTLTLPRMDFDIRGRDIDGDRIHFVGISLGTAPSSVFLGLTSDIRSATLSSPFATWSRILTDPDSVTYGEPIRRSLAASGLIPGTIGFDRFVRDLQTIVDPVDPANYAAATALNPLHVLEVLGDRDVPTGPTDYLAGLWGLRDVTAENPVIVDPNGARGIVRFSSGDHVSLLDPTADPEVTLEMQTQMVTFAVTNGTMLAITDTSAVQ